MITEEECKPTLVALNKVYEKMVDHLRSLLQSPEIKKLNRDEYLTLYFNLTARLAADTIENICKMTGTKTLKMFANYMESVEFLINANPQMTPGKIKIHRMAL